jgi:hypothetical protein
MLATLAGCMHASNTKPAREAGVLPPAERLERVLLVGNSLSYRNDLPSHLAAIATAMRGARVEVEMIAGGGERIDQHRARGLVQRELATGHYSALVLQEWGRGLRCDEQVAQLGFDCAASHAAHRALADAAKRYGLRIVLLGTYSMDAEDALALDAAERKLAREIGVAHVGLGDWPAARIRAPERAWLDADGAHPGLDLTLLMALRTSAALYGDRALPVPLEIAYRDYRGEATPKPDRLASLQTLQAPQRVRRLVDSDLQGLEVR